MKRRSFLSAVILAPITAPSVMPAAVPRATYLGPISDLVFYYPPLVSAYPAELLRGAGASASQMMQWAWYRRGLIEGMTHD